METKDLVSLDELELAEPHPSTPKAIRVEDIITLWERGWSTSEIAKQLGCTAQNVRRRLNKILGDLRVARQYKKHRGSHLVYHQSRFLGSITDAEIKKMPVASRVTSAAILFDKEQLVEGKATHIVGYAHYLKKEEDLREELRKVKEEMNTIDVEPLKIEAKEGK